MRWLRLDSFTCFAWNTAASWLLQSIWLGCRLFCTTAQTEMAKVIALS